MLAPLFISRPPSPRLRPVSNVRRGAARPRQVAAADRGHSRERPVILRLGAVAASRWFRVAAAWLLAVALAAGCRRAAPESDQEPLAPSTPVLSWQEATERLAALEARPLPRPDDERRVPVWANVGTALRCARFWLDHYLPSPAMLERVAAELTQAEKAFHALTTGAAWAPSPGLGQEGYHADNDDSFQPFVRYVPPVALRGRRVPLIVFLHGYSPALDLVNWTGLPRSLMEFVQTAGWCLAAPFGRSNTDFQGIGEQDVMRVIREMQARYPIDEDRIILAGISMGGMGAWTLGAHYPDVFAGLVVVAGRGDYYFWHQVARDSLPSYKRTLVDTEFAWSLLPNLDTLPIYCIHGEADTLVSVREARHMAAAVGSRNHQMIYVELPGADHWIYEEAFARPDLRVWLRARRRSTPATFSYVTYHPAYRRVWWAELGDFAPGAGPATVSVAFDRRALRLSVTGTERVTVFQDLLPDATRRLPIVCEGATLSLAKRPAASDPPEARGPIKAAFLGPFLFVRAAPATAEADTLRFEMAVRDWTRFSKSPPRTAEESSLSLQALSAFHVFLFGEPETSALIRRVLADSPIQVTDQHFVVGRHRFPRRGNGLYMARPSPWNRRRLAVVQCGLRWGDHLSENHKYDFLPDYIVYTSEADPDGSNRALCAGFFGEDWGLDDERMFLREPAIP